MVARLIKWSKLPILGTSIAFFALGRATSSVGAKETLSKLKIKTFFGSSSPLNTLKLKTGSMQKTLGEGLRLTSKLLNAGADLLSPKKQRSKRK